MKKYKDITKQYLDDATPGKGNIDYDKKFDKQKYKKELSNALIIHSTFGGDILLLNPNNYRQKSPDYLWNDELWELKNPTTLRALDRLIRNGLKQIRNYEGGIIIDISRIDFTIEEICSIVSNRVKRDLSKDVVIDLIVVKNKKIIKVLRI